MRRGNLRALHCSFRVRANIALPLLAGRIVLRPQVNRRAFRYQTGNERAIACAARDDDAAALTRTSMNANASHCSRKGGQDHRRPVRRSQAGAPLRLAGSSATTVFNADNEPPQRFRANRVRERKAVVIEANEPVLSQPGTKLD